MHAHKALSNETYYSRLLN